MNEEEIIETLQVLIGLNEFNKLSYKENKAIQAILNLYQKEKEKNKELEKYEEYYKDMEEVNKKFISADKIKEKIEELESKYVEDVKDANDYDTNQFVVDCVAILEELLEEE